jgi:ATP-dependent DNA helicase RecQ
MSTATLETYVDLSRSRLEMMLKVLDVDGAVQRVSGGWVATGQEWSYDRERYARVAEARQREQQAMLDYLTWDGCRMAYLRGQLDDPAPEHCGRCDNCGGLPTPTTVSEESAAEAREALSRPGVAIAPRKMWPTALANLGIELKGKISDGADEGRAIARLTDLGHGQALRELFRDTTPDGAVPLPLIQAMVTVLQDWRPRVDAIVFTESARRPGLVRDLADGLSRYLQVPIVGRWSIVDPSVDPGRGAANSAQRVAAVLRRSGLEGEIPEGARVLLVDDRTSTGWTLTVAARAIRAAGAESVVPLVLAADS